MQKKIKLLFVAIVLSMPVFAQQGEQNIVVGNQSSNYNVPNQTRGYYFVAPASFTLCGLHVQNDTTIGMQNVAVVRFTNGVPPTWTGTTNDFDTLFYANNQPVNDTISCHINIFKGDIIGVYGCLATSGGSVMYNSLGTTNYTASVYGHSFTLVRSGMNFPLNTQQPHDLFKEPTLPIGRIMMFYNCCEPPRPDSIAGPAHICLNDTATFIADTVPNTLQYFWQLPTGFTLISGQGTDTISIVANMQIQDSIRLKAINSCDTSAGFSIPVSSMDIIPAITQSGDSLISSPENNYQWFLNGNAISGANNQWYVPTQNGSYAVQTDTGNCSYMSAAYNFTDYGIESYNNVNITVSPQPATRFITIRLPDNVTNVEMQITSVQGKIIMERPLKNKKTSLSIASIPAGYYFLHIQSGKLNIVKKLVINR